MVYVCIAVAMLSGCASTVTVRFQPKADQRSLVRDGRSALVSRRKNAMVLVSPATREFRPGGRPVLVVGINNLSKGPLDFKVSDIQGTQMVNGEAPPPLELHSQTQPRKRCDDFRYHRTKSGEPCEPGTIRNQGQHAASG